jgi:uncharacterized glyoxalase superfamily metalloenzyme YdcJ
VETWVLRARFAQRLSDLYGREVPAYTTLVEVAHAVNADVAAAMGPGAERLGSLDRVTAERHGAIRVGTPAELAQVARVFAAMGMHPTGFYDLRDASASSVPVVSTAFRPTQGAELARNPFRVFTSLLATPDRRFFSADLAARLSAFLATRQLFGPRLLALADRARSEGGLSAADAEEFLTLATASFALSREPIDRAWYTELEAVSAVAADIGGVRSTHVNHLTPRVLDIDDLYQRMSARGITMIDEIQGPPRWSGPDVLLRQTSFRALAEARVFREADGSLVPGSLRVRFGEVEARGIALTRAGRARYEAATPDTWAKSFPGTETALFAQGLGVFTAVAADRPRDGTLPPSTLAALLEQGWLEASPVVYEDFLPRSAAGIFQSNLTGAGSKDADVEGAALDADWLEGVLEMPLGDPDALYAAQRDASLGAALGELGLDPAAVPDLP